MAWITRATSAGHFSFSPEFIGINASPGTLPPLAVCKEGKLKVGMSQNEIYNELLALLVSQYPGRAALTRTETACALGYKNAITVDRLRERHLLRPSLATRKPTYSLVEIARFQCETTEGV